MCIDVLRCFLFVCHEVTLSGLLDVTIQILTNEWTAITLPLLVS